jgi:RecA-family ATPase
LVQAIADLNPVLVILDTLADVYGGNELDRVQVNYFCKTVLNGLIQLQKSRGQELTVLLLGHPSVSGSGGGGRGYSGSTAWNAAVRCRIYLTRPEDEDPNTRILTRGKSNYSASGDSTAIRLSYANGVLIPEQTVDLSQISHALETQIKTRVKAMWDAYTPFSVSGSHARFWKKELTPALTASGYSRDVAEGAVQALITAGVLGQKRTGERSGLWVPGRG